MRSSNGSESTHCRTGTEGSTRSTRCAAVFAMRRPAQLGQMPRALQENATRRSCRPHRRHGARPGLPRREEAGHRRRAAPCDPRVRRGRARPTRRACRERLRQEKGGGDRRSMERRRSGETQSTAPREKRARASPALARSQDSESNRPHHLVRSSKLRRRLLVLGLLRQVRDERDVPSIRDVPGANDLTGASEIARYAQHALALVAAFFGSSKPCVSANSSSRSRTEGRRRRPNTRASLGYRAPVRERRRTILALAPSALGPLEPLANAADATAA
jgi:hypothetical protein